MGYAGTKVEDIRREIVGKGNRRGIEFIVVSVMSERVNELL